MTSEHLYARAPLEPLVGRRPQRPCPPTSARRPKTAPAPHATLRRGTATRHPTPTPLACAPPDLVARSHVGYGMRAAPPSPSAPPPNAKVHRRGATALDDGRTHVCAASGATAS